MSREALRVLVSGGGSGGHIYPAVAIVEAIQRRVPDAEILFVGGIGKMEMEKIPKLGYNIKGIPIDGFQRSMSLKNIIRNLKLPFKLLYSLFSVMQMINSFKPDVAIGTGGFASGPSLKVAQWMGIPTYLQDQNALPGYTNKLLAPSAKAIFTSFESSKKYFSNPNIIYTGNAIRESLSQHPISREEAITSYGLDPEKKTVFVTGGSLGATPINQAIANNIDALTANNIQLIWQTGSTRYDQYEHLDSDSIRVLGYIQDMNSAYSAADIIVTRAGGALFEMFTVGKPIIVLPSRFVAEDHQTKNAEDLANKNAAILIHDVDADQKLIPTIIDLVQDDEKMQSMSREVKKLAMPNAASEIADYILNALNTDAK